LAIAGQSNAVTIGPAKLPSVENKHTVERGHGITYELRAVLCGKPGCKRHHGPYWYAYWTAGGRARTAYIGKKFQRLEVKNPGALSQKGAWD